LTSEQLLHILRKTKAQYGGLSE